MWRPLSLTICAVVGSTAAAASGALAQNATCLTLVRQYAVASDTAAGGRVNPEAIARQLTERQTAAGANGCAGFNPSRPATAQCPTILADVRQLQARLAQARAAANGQTRSGPSAESIRQQLIRNGCGAPQTQTAAVDSFAIGQGRTLCVRTCDGYYFPISNLAGRSRLETDIDACQSMYAAPGQAKLFVQRRNSDVATAVSADGKLKYADQPYAFAFRQAFNATCQAELHAGLDALARRYSEALARLPSPADHGTGVGPIAYWPIPHPRPGSPGEDPETIAVRAGDLGDAFDRTEPAAAIVAGIRLVGEDWYANLYDPGRPPPPAKVHRPPLGFDLIGAALAAEATASAHVPTQ